MVASHALFSAHVKVCDVAGDVPENCSVVPEKFAKTPAFVTVIVELPPDSTVVSSTWSSGPSAGPRSTACAAVAPSAEVAQIADATAIAAQRDARIRLVFEAG